MSRRIVRDANDAHEAKSQRGGHAGGFNKREAHWRERKKQRALVKITGALCLHQFVRYLRDHLLLDKCVD